MNAGPLEILYQDDRYVVVHKPAGMLVHRTAIDRNERRVCLQVLRKQLGQRVYPCHRLDKPTSGILLFALDKEALLAASSLFAGREVHKAYRAVIRGWLEGSGCVDHPLRHLEEGGTLHGEGIPQEAVSDWTVLSRFAVDTADGPFPTNRYTLVELIPHTGRMHQLRRHMKHLSHPIVGDTRYGDGLHNRFFRSRFGVRRLLLQACQLQFVHPFQATPVHLLAGADPSFQETLRLLQPFLVTAD